VPRSRRSAYDRASTLGKTEIDAAFIGSNRLDRATPIYSHYSYLGTGIREFVR